MLRIRLAAAAVSLALALAACGREGEENNNLFSDAEPNGIVGSNEAGENGATRAASDGPVEPVAPQPAPDTSNSGAPLPPPIVNQSGNQLPASSDERQPATEDEYIRSDKQVDPPPPPEPR